MMFHLFPILALNLKSFYLNLVFRFFCIVNNLQYEGRATTQIKEI